MKLRGFKRTHIGFADRAPALRCDCLVGAKVPLKEAAFRRAFPRLAGTVFSVDAFKGGAPYVGNCRRGTVEKIEELLGATGANLMYAGYPYDPFAPDAPRS